MTDVFLLDPPSSAAWLPFAHCRPVCELRAGAWLVRERWEAVAGGETRAIFGAPHLHGFVEDGVPAVTSRRVVDGPALIGRSDFAPAGVKGKFPDKPVRLVNDGVTVGWWVPERTNWEGDHDDWSEVELEGFALHGAYDLVTALEQLLAPDTMDFTREPGDPLPQGSIVIGDPGDVVILGATVEPGSIFDVREGVVVIEQHAQVKAGTRFEGPVYVGPGTEILGGTVRACSIGPRCRVRGEIAGTVLLGYANKAHDGFVGHSVIGRWVNIGAGTITSNLKNTYGPVRIQVAGEPIETGRQFLGTLFGDHVKTAIGTLLGTGTVLGAGANVFGGRSTPKYVPPFAWGDSDTIMERQGFIKVAERIMPRRQVQVDDAVRTMLGTVYDHAVGG